MLKDGEDQTCANCGYVLYAGHDPSEEFWKRFQAEIPEADRPAPSRDGRKKAEGWHKRRTDVA